MRFKYIHEDDVIGFYELNPLPGCNQVVVSNHAWLAPHMRGKGLGSKAHEQRLKEAKELGYDYIVCTVKSTNLIQIDILKSHQWKCLDQFPNRETGNLVELWGKRL